MYKVYFDNLLVKEIKEAGIQAVSSDKQIKGEVVAMGKGDGKEMMFNIGDVVYFPEFEAVKFNKYYIVSQMFILVKE